VFGAVHALYETVIKFCHPFFELENSEPFLQNMIPYHPKNNICTAYIAPRIRSRIFFLRWCSTQHRGGTKLVCTNQGILEV
jgi:hypothetical protein